MSQNGELDKSQNRRIEALEKQILQTSIELSSLTAKIDTLTNIGKALCILAGAALGIDIIPMMN